MISRIEMIYSIRSGDGKYMANGQMGKIGPSGGDKEFVKLAPCTHILIHASLGKKLEKFELSQSPQAKQGMLKRQDLLDRNLSARGYMPR